MIGISVIICCYNSASRLPDTLAYLQAQKNLSQIAWEIIIVDNASTDNTTEIAWQIWSDWQKLQENAENNFINATNLTNSITFRVLQEKKAGLANARKCGFRAAKYSYFCMVDDDNWLDSNYLRTMYDIFQDNPKIGACGGWGEETFEAHTKVPFWYDTFKNGYAVGKMAEKEQFLRGEKQFLYGAGLSMRKEIWEKLENIAFESMLLGRTADKVTSGEDLEMGYMIRLMDYELFFSPKLHFKHLMATNRLNWEYLKKLKKGFGSSAVYHGFYKNRLHPNTLRTQIRKFWLTEFTANFVVALAKLILFLPYSIIDKEGNKKSASWQYSLGRVTELWNLRNDYQKISKRVANLTNKLRLIA
jgi:glycosyltransferase involved in cell wall biosynthesis